MHETPEDLERLQRLLDDSYARAGAHLRGRFWFGSGEKPVRFRHIRTRPQVSASVTHGEQLAVTVHGVAHEIDALAPEHAGLRDYLAEVYGDWHEWGHAQPSATGKRVADPPAPAPESH